jgi:hypothetical protein
MKEMNVKKQKMHVVLRNREEEGQLELQLLLVEGLKGEVQEGMIFF